MKRSVVLAFVLLVSLASAAFASSDQTPKLEAVAESAPATSRPTVLALLSKDLRTEAYWANYCVTPAGTCQLAVPMQDGSSCECYWYNGAVSFGYAR